MSGKDILAYLFHRLREKFIDQCWLSLCSLLAKEGFRQQEDNAIFLVKEAKDDICSHKMLH